MIQKTLMQIFGLNVKNVEIDYFRLQKRMEYENLKLIDLGYINIRNFIPLPLRTYGIEVEGYIKDKYELKNRLIGLGLRVEICGYNDRTNTYFVLGTDSSLDEEYNGKYPVELTSPKLIGWGQIGMELIQHILEEWNNIGGDVNKKCGVHVHVDTWDFINRRDYYRLAVFCYLSQPFLYSIVPRSRWNNPYCLPLTPDHFESENLMSRLKESRYQIVNFRNPKRVEFRLFSGTLMWEKIEAFVLLSLEMVEAVKFRWKKVKEFIKKGVTGECLDLFEEWLDLLNIKGSHPVRKRVREIIKQRYQTFNSDYLQECEEWRSNIRKAWEFLPDRKKELIFGSSFLI